MIYKDKTSDFSDLLKQDRSITVHDKNLQFLAIEMYKVSKGINSGILSSFFTRRTENNYDLRNALEFRIPRIFSENNGKESFSFLGPKIWDLVPQNLK